jgi:hypothetical protein
MAASKGVGYLQLGVHSTWHGKPSPLHDQEALEPQKIFASGRTSGASSSVPAGITTSRPLRVKWGRGPPQTLQNVVAKLRAEGRSNRFAFSSPDSQENWLGAT